MSGPRRSASIWTASFLPALVMSTAVRGRQKPDGVVLLTAAPVVKPKVAFAALLWTIPGFEEDGGCESQNSQRCDQIETVGATRGQISVAGSQLVLRAGRNVIGGRPHWSPIMSQSDFVVR